MSDFESFATTLENRIRDEIMAEFQLHFEPKSSEISDASGYQYLGWLMGQAPTFVTTPRQGMSYDRSPYTRYHRAPKPRPAHVLTEAQCRALALLKEHAGALSESFDLRELKRSYRLALLKVHPDQGGQTQSFWQVRDAFALLKAVFPSEN